ncbi:MSMEG_0565 family glycosyltransferase [Pseudonocardia sp. CA-142604]|uniref:MSMEG_0565 family glycosyltransferase n=1 Tax=Pseudonocardia sp. CA-142604 TaxID=3240024 RepID=UPI003D9451BC
MALVSHSTTPRGGHVHTLGLAEALHRAGRHPVHLVALGDPGAGLYRSTVAPHTVLQGPSRAGTTLEERVLAAIDLLAAGLAGRIDEFDVLHAQDCIAARAALRAREATGAAVRVLRTAHHVDDFTTPVLIDCQRRAITEPDRVLVVSEQWRTILRAEFGVAATVVPNGVDAARFPAVPVVDRAALRERVGARGPLLLAVGGIEPRKGSVVAFRALARLAAAADADRSPRPLFAVVGGHSFQDFAPYREAALAELPALGLQAGRDVVELGTVSDADLGAWYAAADVLAYPSLKEGFGLVTIEAMSQGLPVVASDVPVFGEYLTDGVDALLPAAGDPAALAAALHAVLTDDGLRERLRVAGAAVAARFTWDAAAARHSDIYTELAAGTPPIPV